MSCGSGLNLFEIHSVFFFVILSSHIAFLARGKIKKNVLVFIFLALPPDTNPASFADINNIQIRQQRHQLCCLPTSTVLTYLTVESMGHYRFLFFCCSCCRWKVAGEPANGFHCKWLWWWWQCCPELLQAQESWFSHCTRQPVNQPARRRNDNDKSNAKQKVNNECCLLCFLFLLLLFIYSFLALDQRLQRSISMVQIFVFL